MKKWKAKKNLYNPYTGNLLFLKDGTYEEVPGDSCRLVPTISSGYTKWNIHGETTNWIREFEEVQDYWGGTKIFEFGEALGSSGTRKALTAVLCYRDSGTVNLEFIHSKIYNNDTWDVPTITKLRDALTEILNNL